MSFFIAVNIRLNVQLTRVSFSRIYSGVHVRPSHLDSHIIIDFFVWLSYIGARVRKLGVHVIITYGNSKYYIY